MDRYLKMKHEKIFFFKKKDQKLKSPKKFATALQNCNLLSLKVKSLGAYLKLLFFNYLRVNLLCHDYGHNQLNLTKKLSGLVKQQNVILREERFINYNFCRF